MEKHRKPKSETTVQFQTARSAFVFVNDLEQFLHTTKSGCQDIVNFLSKRIFVTKKAGYESMKMKIVSTVDFIFMNN